MRAVLPACFDECVRFRFSINIFHWVFDDEEWAYPSQLINSREQRSTHERNVKNDEQSEDKTDGDNSLIVHHDNIILLVNVFIFISAMKLKKSFTDNKKKI